MRPFPFRADVVLTACAVSVLAVGAVAGGPGRVGSDAAGQDGSAHRVIEVVAERFSFQPSEITVDEGTTVEIRLTSEDTIHGFRLIGPGGVDVEIPKRGRGEARVTFNATTPGRYTFECNRICGAGHAFMRGTLRVRPRAQGSGS